MSGGRFNHTQGDILEIADIIQSAIYENDRKKDWKYTEEGPGYSVETIREFSNAIQALRKAYVYAQRIDWLLSYDDSEEAFHERLKQDLEEIKNNGGKSK